MSGKFGALQKVFAVVGVYLAVAALQFVHYRYYYDRTLFEAVTWSVIDWAIWFLLIGGLYYLLAPAWRRLPTVKSVSLLLAVIAVSGVFHIILSTCVYLLYMPSHRPFIADILHLYDKRWLPNLFYAAVLWYFYKFLFAPDQSVADSVNGHPPARFKVSDGSADHWLQHKDIRYLKAEGNYILIDTPHTRLTVRGPLRKFEEKLPSPPFVRISRSCLVNIAHIASIERYSDHSKQILMKNGERLNIGRTYLARLKDIFLR